MLTFPVSTSLPPPRLLPPNSGMFSTDFRGSPQFSLPSLPNVPTLSLLPSRVACDLFQGDSRRRAAPKPPGFLPPRPTPRLSFHFLYPFTPCQDTESFCPPSGLGIPYPNPPPEPCCAWPCQLDCPQSGGWPSRQHVHSSTLHTQMGDLCPPLRPDADVLGLSVIPLPLHLCTHCKVSR